MEIFLRRIQKGPRFRRPFSHQTKPRLIKNYLAETVLNYPEKLDPADDRQDGPIAGFLFVQGGAETLDKLGLFQLEILFQESGVRLEVKK